MDEEGGKILTWEHAHFLFHQVNSGRNEKER